MSEINRIPLFAIDIAMIERIVYLANSGTIDSKKELRILVSSMLMLSGIYTTHMSTHFDIIDDTEKIIAYYVGKL